MTTSTNPLAGVPMPAGAVRVDDEGWINARTPEAAYRYWTGTTRVVERNDRETDLTVHIGGVQYGDGRVDRDISVHRLDGHNDPLTPDQARQLARHLIAAADQADQMDGYDQTD